MLGVPVDGEGSAVVASGGRLSFGGRAAGRMGQAVVGALGRGSCRCCSRIGDLESEYGRFLLRVESRDSPMMAAAADLRQDQTRTPVMREAVYGKRYLFHQRDSTQHAGTRSH